MGSVRRFSYRIHRVIHKMCVYLALAHIGRRIEGCVDRLFSIVEEIRLHFSVANRIDI
jgi:hypothetical protein